MKKIEQEKNRPASNIPYQGVNKPFRTYFIMPGPGVTIEQDANGVLYISAEGGAGVADLKAGDNIVLTKTDDGKIIISAVDTATDIAAGQNITIDIDPETGTAIINSITGGATNEHYQGIFDTAEDLIAFDTDPEIGDYGMIKNVTYSDGGETTWNGQYKYCFYINGQWTVVDQMLTFTDDIELLQQFYSVGGSSPVIYLHKIAQTGSFNDLRDVPIVATPVLTVEGDTVTATCATEGAEIWYTIDGTMPHVNGIRYTGPVTVTGATTFRFVGIKNGMINSLEATVGVDYQLQPPTIDLDWHDGTITMANPNQSGTIYYTTDGSTPTNASNAYTGPFIIDEATLFKIVVIDGNNQSSVTEQQYMQAHPVSNFSISTNYVFGRATIRFSNSEEGEAHYEMYDSNPTFNSPLSQGSITFPYYDHDNPRYYSVRVFKEGKVPSIVARSPQNGKQKPTAPEISFDPDSGLVSINRISETLSIQLVTVLLTSGCTIRYTIDGSTPTADSLVYNGPFQISGNVTVKAVLIAYGQYYSDVASKDIAITTGPAITLDSDSGDVTITGPSGASIYYTTDGSTPTSSSRPYSGPFNVENRDSVTIKAVAILDGQESSVSEATFPGLLRKWSGSFGGETNYLSGKITRTPRTPADGASVFYDVSASGFPSSWTPYKGDPVEIDFFSEDNPREFLFRQTKPGWIPAYYGGTRVGYKTPDAPVISYDDTTGTATIALSGNTEQIPLQTNNNTPTLGARIYYTTDGSTPTAQNGTLYRGKDIIVPEGTTAIKAVTVCYGEWESEVTTEEITPGPMFLKAVQAGSSVTMRSELATAPDLEYSTDGETWQAWGHRIQYGVHLFDIITLEAVGDRVYFRGDNPNGFSVEDGSKISQFVLNGQLAGGGNVMSLLDKSMELPEVPNHGFYLLFGSNSAPVYGLVTAPFIGASTIGDNGCNGMFSYCASLTAAANMPNLTTIGMAGCGSMYNGCTSLKAAANMPNITTIATNGCWSMYDGCTSLTAAADMPNLISIGVRSCRSMYNDCTSLTAAADMPNITSIGERGCELMYYGCTSLKAAANMPNLTTIGNTSCGSMYQGCTSLTAAADMPNLTSIDSFGCYSMYASCTSLTAAADMPNLASIGMLGCAVMYYGCTSLKAAANMPNITTIGKDGCKQMYEECSFLMSDDGGQTLNFGFPALPITAGSATYSTPLEIGQWMSNTNGLT